MCLLQRRRHKKVNFALSFILSLSLLNLPAALAAVKSKEAIVQKQKKLRQIKQKLIGTKQGLVASKQRRSKLEEDLKKNEVAIGVIAKKLPRLKEKLRKQQAILAPLKQKQVQYQADLSKQQAAFAKQIRDSYLLGKHEYLKLLLNQQDPNQISLILKYYAYINKARLHVIQKLDQTLQHIEKNSRQIREHTGKLQRLVAEKARAKQRLETHEHQRLRILSRVKQQIQTKSQKLHQLEKNQQALAQIIKRLKQTPVTVRQHVSFKRMRGKLPWPVVGKISKAFTTHIQNSNLLYDGVFIKAKLGTPIHAIYPGKVVFANWLRGLGLLIIVSHGHGFMTLFGHAHSLYEKVGEYVKAGNVIATVGKSGGYSQSGLYFQIREYGKPLNPAHWCR